MPGPPQFRLRTALASVAVAAPLLASLRTPFSIGFVISSMFVGAFLSVGRLAASAALWKAALAGPPGGALGAASAGSSSA